VSPEDPNVGKKALKKEERKAIFGLNVLKINTLK
jgi:hypothetical protein